MIFGCGARVFSIRQRFPTHRGMILASISYVLQ
jgi:hypothetical protein